MGDGRAVAPQRAPLSGAVPDDSHVPRPANHRGECRQPRILGKRLHLQDTDLRHGVDPGWSASISRPRATTADGCATHRESVGQLVGVSEFGQGR